MSSFNVSSSYIELHHICQIFNLRMSQKRTLLWLSLYIKRNKKNEAPTQQFTTIPTLKVIPTKIYEVLTFIVSVTRSTVKIF